MATFYQYELGDGLSVLIEGPDQEVDDFSPTARTAEENIVKIMTSFDQALGSINAQAKKLQEKLKGLKADEIQIAFGLVTTGEMGFFGVGKLGAEINYEVTLTWKPKE